MRIYLAEILLKLSAKISPNNKDGIRLQQHVTWYFQEFKPKDEKNLTLEEYRILDRIIQPHNILK